VMARVGSPEESRTPWREHVTAIRRGQNRRRAALLARTVATAGALGSPSTRRVGHRASMFRGCRPRARPPLRRRRSGTALFRERSLAR
jgi:hypothetical protein